MAPAALGRFRERLERHARAERRQRGSRGRGLLHAAVALAFAAVSVAALAGEDLGPAWTQLKPDQQRILAPLQDDWPNLEGQRKRKWIAIANRYPQLSADEQARVQRRMKEWASLTPDQRDNARHFYRDLEKLSPEEKQTVREKWEAYQQLPEDKRRQLTTSAPQSADQGAAIPTYAPVEPAPPSK